MNKCSICGSEVEDVTHLPLYVIGSEGIVVCLPCRIALSKVAEGMMNAATRSKMQAYRTQEGKTNEN